MKSWSFFPTALSLALAAALGSAEAAPVAADAAKTASSLNVGIARRDITPAEPIWLSGYAARERPSERVDHALKVTAIYLDSGSGERCAIVAVDNCELSPAFAANLQKQIEKSLSLGEGAAIVVTSHTHSAPVLEDALSVMYHLDDVQTRRVEAYGKKLRSAVIEAIAAARKDARPAHLEYAVGRAGFAMNRRIYTEKGMAFGENPFGPRDLDVPVLKITGADGSLRAVVYGYACHGTSIAGDDFYVVCGDYMAYARDYIEAVFPGVSAVYLTGFGADINPSPRGRLLDAKQHGLELAGAVTGVLSRPMRRIEGPLRRAFARIDLPLAEPPTREKIVADSRSENPYIRARALMWLRKLDDGAQMPRSVSCALEVVRLGGDLTFFFLAGEVVVDYSLRIKREFAADTPWPVGYAFDVPCYIPDMRILKEGGYEADSSLIYYGIYGPLLGRCENMIHAKFRELARSTLPRGTRNLPSK